MNVLSMCKLTKNMKCLLIKMKGMIMTRKKTQMLKMKRPAIRKYMYNLKTKP